MKDFNQALDKSLKYWNYKAKHHSVQTIGIQTAMVFSFSYAFVSVPNSMQQRLSVFSVHPHSMIASPASALAPKITGTSTRSFWLIVNLHTFPGFPKQTSEPDERILLPKHCVFAFPTSPNALIVIGIQTSTS